MRYILASFLAYVLSTISPVVYAFTNLLGPDARLVPYVDMPFVSSTVVKNTGERLPDGGCRFPVHVELSPGMLQDNEVFVKVRRAIDPIQCEEVLEQGVAIKPLPEAAQSSASATDNLIHETINIIGQSQGGGDVSTSSASLNQEASGYLKYTDGRNPLIKPFRDLTSWDGITASEVYASISGEWSDSRSCPYPDTYWTISYGTDYSFFWDERVLDYDYIYAACDFLQLDVNREHYTDSKNDLLGIDCSEGAAITYNPIRFRVERDGRKVLDRTSVQETGPMEKCREYLVRFEVFE